MRSGIYINLKQQNCHRFLSLLCSFPAGPISLFLNYSTTYLSFLFIYLWDSSVVSFSCNFYFYFLFLFLFLGGCKEDEMGSFFSFIKQKRTASTDHSSSRNTSIGIERRAAEEASSFAKPSNSMSKIYHSMGSINPQTEKKQPSTHQKNKYDFIPDHFKTLDEVTYFLLSILCLYFAQDLKITTSFIFLCSNIFFF